MKISKKLVLWCAFLVILFVQVPHLAKEFADMSSLTAWNGWMAITHGTLFAIAIDACVLLFAIRGRELYTMIFMIISYVVTLQYYREFMDLEKDVLLATSTLLIALAGVIAIYFLSREVNVIDAEEKATVIVNSSLELTKKLQEHEEKIRKEITQQEGVTFTDDEIEVIRMRKDNRTYDDIINHFRSTDRIMTRDRIGKIQQKFKELHTNEGSGI